MFRLTLAPHKVQLLNYKKEINKQSDSNAILKSSGIQVTGDL